MRLTLISEVFYSLKKADEKRIESEKKFETLFNNSSDEIYLTDFSGKIIEANQIVCDILGYAKNEILNMSCKDLKSEKYKYVCDSILDKIKKEKKLIIESEHKAKDGLLIPVEIKSKVIYKEISLFL